jgi:hypothetical protein
MGYPHLSYSSGRNGYVWGIGQSGTGMEPWAYIRIKDENILATPVHLKMWQHSKKPEGALVTFTEREQRLLDALKEKEKLSLNQCCKLCRLNHKTTCELLADFIRFGLVELVFHGHKFYFKLNKE